jgi:hypothetical protein
MIRAHDITRQPATDHRVRGAGFGRASRGIAHSALHAAGFGGRIAT